MTIGMADGVVGEQPRADHGEEADLDREDEEQQELVAREKRGKCEKGRAVEQAAAPCGAGQQEISEQQAEEAGVEEHRGAERPPGLLERIVDQEADDHREVEEDHPQQGEAAEGVLGKQEGGHPPDLAAEDLRTVEVEQGREVGAHPREGEGQHTEQDVIAEEPGKREPPEPAFDTVEPAHGRRMAGKARLTRLERCRSVRARE